MNHQIRNHTNYLITDGGTSDEKDGGETNEGEDDEKSIIWLAIAILFAGALVKPIKISTVLHLILIVLGVVKLKQLIGNERRGEK